MSHSARIADVKWVLMKEISAGRAVAWLSTMVLVSFFLCLPAQRSYAEPMTQYVDDFFYKMGGGRAIPRGASGYVTYRIGARFTVSPGYSCGKFSIEQNLEQALNRVRDQMTGLPDQLGMAATGMISSLPMYLLKNYASDVYGILMWNLDQSIELFRFQYKTCETLEAEIMKNNEEYNPYSTATRAAVLNQWEYGANGAGTIDETSRGIQSNPGQQGFNFLGNGRGTPDRPIPLKHDLMVLAYNNRLGRTEDPLDTSAPTGHDNDVLVQTWPDPQVAADWVVAATGEFWLVVGQNSPKDSAPGIGLRPEIDLLTDNYAIALNNAIELNDYHDLDTLEQNVPRKLRITDRVIKGLRNLPGDQKAIATERLASDTAIAIVKNKVDLATNLFRAAMQDPDVATSQIASVAGNVASQTRTWLREEMEEIAQMMAIDRSGASKTPVIIMNHGAQESSQRTWQPANQATNPNPIGRDSFPVTDD